MFFFLVSDFNRLDIKENDINPKIETSTNFIAQSKVQEFLPNNDTQDIKMKTCKVKH